MAWRLDVRLAALATSVGATYSRYADDLAFSGDLGRIAPRLLGLIAVIVRDEGFTLNQRKTRVMHASGRQELTGLGVNAHPNLRRAEVDRLKAILHACATHGPEGQDRDGHPDFRAHLAGRVAWVRHVNPARGARFQALFDAIRW